MLLSCLSFSFSVKQVSSIGISWHFTPTNVSPKEGIWAICNFLRNLPGKIRVYLRSGSSCKTVWDRGGVRSCCAAALPSQTLYLISTWLLRNLLYTPYSSHTSNHYHSSEQGGFRAFALFTQIESVDVRIIPRKSFQSPTGILSLVPPPAVLGCIRYEEVSKQTQDTRFCEPRAVN